MIRMSLILWLSLIAALTLPTRFAVAQPTPNVDGRYFPLNQMTPPGVAAEWAAKTGRTTPEYFQPVRVSLPTTGSVTFYEGSPDRGIELPAPAQASLIVGRTYRLKVSGLPEFPGIDFFPSIELIDRLHPPAGQVEDFPVDFEMTLEELEWAVDDRLVTKVVYLEQPNRVPVTMLDTKPRIKTVAPFQNVIAEADSLGRPVAIVRMGGRTPDANRPDPAFFGPGGPVRIVERAPKTTSRSESARTAKTAANDAGVFHLRSAATRRMAQR